MKVLLVLKSFFLLISLLISLLFLACPKPSDNKPPEKADCDPGFLPCEEDSTICCEVICPPGTLLGGKDSTECIPVECPPNYHLCGPDSTDCCLDTTSHAMIWEVDTIFTGFVNWAMDVAIINDTTIWVVGDFELDDPEDTLTSFEERFNLVEWNGTNWELEKIVTPNSTNLTLIRSVFVIDPNTIWTGGWAPFFWDGVKWSRPNIGSWPAFDNYGQITAIWASSPDDVFFGSVNGQINHWDGSGFTRMETPTNVHLTDINGTGPSDVWAVGNDLSIAKSTVIHYDGVEWKLLYETGVTPGWTSIDSSLSGNIKQVQTFDNFTNEAWILGNTYGIYHTTSETAPDADLIKIEFKGKPLSKLRGNHPNDLYIAAHYSGVFHYNGIDIKEYSLPGDLYINGMDVRKNLVIIIGFEGKYLVAYRGIKFRE